MKLVGATLAFSLLISPNVHAEELDDLIDSEGITTISEGIDNLNNQVDALSENCTDEGMSSEISNISIGINSLDDQIDLFADGYVAFMSAIFRNKADIISGLNRNVYVQNNISEDASYEDIISKINDIKYRGTLDVSLESNDKYILESGYYDGGTIDVSAIIEAARQEAYEKGLEEGKKQAIEDNKQTWINEGKKQAIDENKQTWIDAGKEQAIVDNKQKWIDEGKGIGKNSVKARKVASFSYRTFSDDGNYKGHFDIATNMDISDCTAEETLFLVINNVASNQRGEKIAWYSISKLSNNSVRISTNNTSAVPYISGYVLAIK